MAHVTMPCTFVQGRPFVPVISSSHKAQNSRCIRRTRQCQAQTQPEDESSRRRTIQSAAALVLLPLAALVLSPNRVSAADTDAARKELLAAIAAKKGDDGVIKALRELQKANPTPKPAKTDLLYGKWKLLWASDNSEVSIATRKLPLNAKSVQLVGRKGGEPEGRAANLIQLFGGGVTVKLSSAAVPDEKSDDTILIGPPFYLEQVLRTECSESPEIKANVILSGYCSNITSALQLKLGGLSIPIQNTQKEGERKSLLGAEQNYYVQLYLEDTGKPGDLRISEVKLGDPAAKGSIFVHERI